jgi:cephalosporin hydroxylase
MRGLLKPLARWIRRWLLAPLQSVLLRDISLRENTLAILQPDFLRLFRKDEGFREAALQTVHPKALIQSLREAGVDGFLHQPGFDYQPNYYGSSWFKRTDIRQLPVFGTVAANCLRLGRTLLHYDRLYILYQAICNLQRRLPRTLPWHLAEVGVYRGGTSYFLASLLRALEIPAFELHCFDTFEGHAGQDIADEDRYVTSGQDRSHQAGHFTDTSLEQVQEFLKPWPEIQFHRGRFQDTGHQVEGRMFHFVHLDMDLYAPTLFALNFFHRHLAPGGVIVVDDFEVNSCPGVKEAVRDFLAQHRHYLALHPMTEQCLLLNVGEQAAELDRAKNSQAA